MLLYVLLGILGLILILALIAPKSYDVNRSIIIDRPVHETFRYLKMIKNQDHWSPWKKKDPNLKQSFSGTDGEVGFVAHWEGNKDVGVGEQEIKHIIENTIIESELRFYKPWKSQSDAYLKVDSVDNGKTEVTWGFSGKNKFPASIFMLFFNMDKTVGKDFEEGLDSLKSIFEK
jgi:hypothetical protein